MKWVRITLEDSSYKVEEIKEEKTPKITFVCEPRRHLHDVKCEMEAIVPEELKGDIIEVWHRRNELDNLELVAELMGIIYEVDDNPFVEMKFDNYELEIKINPD